jgi:antitoxin YefM
MMAAIVQFHVHKINYPTMRVINYTEARASLKLVLDTVTQDHDVMVINRRDGADAVVMGLDHYQSVMETLYLMSSPANAAALNKAIAQDVGRKAVPHELLAA